MVDLHSHILPGIDDGARTIEESLEMLTLAAATGTTDIVATPHANAQFPHNAPRIEEAFRELSARAGDLIRLHLGCDLHLDFDNLRDVLRNPTKYTINQSQYLMVELPDLISLPSTREALRQLINIRIIPVITHPERNLSLQLNLQELKKLVADGCLLQVTAQSLLGGFGREAKRSAHSLLDTGLVHFVASDAHDCVRRPPKLAAASEYVASRYGSRRAHALFTANPNAVLLGGRVAVENSSHFLNNFRRFLRLKRH